MYIKLPPTITSMQEIAMTLNTLHSSMIDQIMTIITNILTPTSTTMRTMITRWKLGNGNEKLVLEVVK